MKGMEGIDDVDTAIVLKFIDVTIAALRWQRNAAAPSFLLQEPDELFMTLR